MKEKRGPLRLAAESALRELYELADTDGTAETCDVEGLGTYRVKTAGKRAAYSLMLLAPNYRLFVHHATGHARFVAGAAWLAAQGPSEVLIELMRLAEWLWGSDDVAQWRSTRIDVAADFVGLPLELFEDLGCVVRRSRTATVHPEEDEGTGDRVSWVGPRIQGVSLGTRSGAVSAVVYNKGRQVRAEGLRWVDAMHTDDGWDGQAERTRVEFRLRNRGLVWGVDGIDVDLRDPLAVLQWQAWAPRVWAYLTTKWLRLVDTPWEEDADSNRWRWPTHRAWRAVQQLGNVAAERSRVVACARIEEARWRARRGLVRAALALAAVDDRVRAVALEAARLAHDDRESAVSWAKAFVASVATMTADDALRDWAAVADPAAARDACIECVDARVKEWRDVIAEAERAGPLVVFEGGRTVIRAPA